MRYIPEFLTAKAVGRRIVMTTCYDYPSAAALVRADVDAVLVGDSCAMVVYGHESTLHAELPQLCAHTAAVRRGAPELVIIADMPFLSTRCGIAKAVEAAGQLMKAGANAVKIEGVEGHEKLIPRLIQSGIPVMGHLGLQPQQVHSLGGYKKQGKDSTAQEAILQDAQKLQELGCFSVVLECVPSSLGKKLSKSLNIPVIGIGAGADTDGQILVLHDLAGLNPGIAPSFVKRYADLGAQLSDAVSEYAGEVRSGNYTAKGFNRAASPLIVRSPEDWKSLCKSLSRQGSVGFVPTMGALHEGHAALLRRCAAENDFALASIFVNPSQFNDPRDLAAYPVCEKEDLQLLEACGVYAVFMPDAASMYPDEYTVKVQESCFSQGFCGEGRPGHFDGVCTVVLKLLLLSGATRAYFGEKDWQQLAVIRALSKAFFLDTGIVPCPIVREPSGLAMSSRNMRLSAAGREKAAAIYKALKEGPSVDEVRKDLESQGFDVEYVDDMNGERRLCAVCLEGVRLIDNVPVQKGEGV